MNFNNQLTGGTTGTFANSSAGSTDYWAAFNTNGALQWRKQFGTGATELAQGVAVEGRNRYLAGSTTGNLEGTNAGAMMPS
jgi:hypothetical protein